MTVYMAAAEKIGRPDAGVDWILFAALVVVILLSGAVQYFNIFVLAGANFVLQLILLWRINFRFSAKIGKAALFILVYLLYGIAVTRSVSDIAFIAFRFHDIITAVLVLNYLIVRRRGLEKTLSATLIFFLVHGFLNWGIVNAAFGLFAPSPDIKSHHFLAFFGMDEQYLGIHRSQGLFWEPGVYQLYLNVALHYFLFYCKRYLLAALAFLGVVLTLSTTGIVIAGIQLCYFALFSDRRLSRRLLILLAALPMLFYYANFASMIVGDKLYGERSPSFLARSFDTRTGIAIALQNPFGIGFNPETYQSVARENVFNVDTPLVTDRGQTNGVLILAYSTGLFWAAILLLLTFKQRIFPAHRTLFFILLIGSLTTEPLFFSPFVFLFTLSGLINFFPLDRGSPTAFKRMSVARTVNAADAT